MSGVADAIAALADRHFADPATAAPARAARAYAGAGLAFVIVVFRDADGDDALECVVATTHRSGSAS